VRTEENLAVKISPNHLLTDTVAWRRTSVYICL